jgi:hypothetical protein
VCRAPGRGRGGHHGAQHGPHLGGGHGKGANPDCDCRFACLGSQPTLFTSDSNADFNRLVDLDVFDGLLLPAVLGRPQVGLPGGHQRHPRPQHLHAGQDLEAGHLFLQRKAVVFAHDHHPEQVRQVVSGREGALFVKVSFSPPSAHPESIAIAAFSDKV